MSYHSGKHTLTQNDKRMKELHRKYIDNNLTAAELRELRQQMNLVPDKEVETLLTNDWEQDLCDGTLLEEAQLRKMKTVLHQTLDFAKPQKRFLNIFYRVAAILLLPILLFSTIYFYNESHPTGSPEIIVSTGKGERATIALPDGTKVVLNEESMLAYSSATFSKQERGVRFEGEAHFDVVKQNSIPFIVYTDNLELKVLGTKFNVMDHKKQDEVEVFLEQGRVRLRSLLSLKEVEMIPNHKAILCKKTGLFKIETEPPRKSLSWMKGELYFADMPLERVLQSLEKCYNIRFKKLPDTLQRDLFSGTLPSKNLLEALNIIKEAYGLSYIVSDNIITFSDFIQ